MMDVAAALVHQALARLSQAFDPREFYVNTARKKADSVGF
jgi:hypothetical protein